MSFATLLQKLLEKSIQFFNTGDYSALGELIIDNVVFSAPLYDNAKIYSPAVCFVNKHEVFAYWENLHKNFEFQVTNLEYLQVEKISIIRNTMPGIGYIIDAEIHFDEYGKVTKIMNTIFQEI